MLGIYKFSATVRSSSKVSECTFTVLCLTSFILLTPKVHAEPIKIKVDLKAGSMQGIATVACAENIIPSNAAKVVDWDNKKIYFSITTE